MSTDEKISSYDSGFRAGIEAAAKLTDSMARVSGLVAASMGDLTFAAQVTQFSCLASSIRALAEHTDTHEVLEGRQ